MQTHGKWRAEEEPFYYCFRRSLEYHFVSQDFRYKDWILYIFMLMRPKN